jgi:transcriptional/translational regulatory protein YebC/TACO1
MYDLKGKFVIPSENVDEEALLMAAIDNDVSDVELVEGDEEGTSVVYTDPKETGAMFEALGSMGLADGTKMSLTYVTKAPVECSDEDFEKNMAIIDALEELDDVDSVEHNMSN